MNTDVNTSFAAERADQLQAQADRQADIRQRLADGKLTALGNDSYRINDPGSWDNGEVVTLAAGKLVAEHGLDTSTGTAALYSAVPAWHGLGQVIPGGTESVADVLALARLDWTVEKVPALYEWDNEVREHEGKFHTVRSDNGRALGAVGADYRVIQNARVFQFLQDLVDRRDVIWESAGALREGRRVFVSMRVAESIVIDQGGLDDEVALFIVAMNSHDGSSQSETVLTPWRPVCGNTERFATRDARARWGIRHTTKALDRLDEARRTLGLTLTYATAFEAEETALARTNLGIDEFHRVLADLWPVDDDATDRTKKYAERRAGLLDAMFRSESERTGRTAYGAERTLTDYLDHVAPRRPGKTMTQEIARAAALLEGADDHLKSRAHERLMLVRTNR